MGPKQVIPCAICAHPQNVDTEELYSKIAKATKITIEEVRSANYEFICYDCRITDAYKNDYFLGERKSHAVLAKEAAVING